MKISKNLKFYYAFIATALCLSTTQLHSMDIIEEISYPRPLVILGCSGGGIRGYVSARILEELEKAVGAPIHQIISGSIGDSTGAIISAEMALDPSAFKDNISRSETESVPQRVAKLYVQKGPSIFSSQQPCALLDWLQKTSFGSFFTSIKNVFYPKYDGIHLRKILEEDVKDLSLLDTRFAPQGKSSMTSSRIIPKRIELALLTCDMRTGTTYEFNSEKIRRGEQPNFLLKDALYAASAQATTFPTAHIHPIGPDKKYNMSQVFDLIDEGPLDNPIFPALQMGLRQLKERGIDPMKELLNHYHEYKNGSRPPLLRIVHIGTGHHTTRMLPPEQFHQGGILKIMPNLLTTLLENQNVNASQTVQLFAEYLPFVSFYNLEGETSISSLVDDQPTPEAFKELERVAMSVTKTPDFINLSKSLKKEMQTDS